MVTGGAGYLGSVLCEHLLAAGCKVTVLDNLLYDQATLFHMCANPHFEFVFGDVRDEKLMADLILRHDVLIPLACIVGAAACDRDPLMARTVNFEAVALLDRLRSNEQLVIYPTTNSGYGTKSGDVFCTEETPLQPISLYGTTKADAEAALLQSPNTITLRLATVFGMSPRMRLDLLVNHFVHAAITDRYLVIFEKHFVRNYIHIRDVADCFIHCMRNSRAMTFWSPPVTSCSRVPSPPTRIATTGKWVGLGIGKGHARKHAVPFQQFANAVIQTAQCLKTGFAEALV